jgi:CheY-like chemotaxis protein
VALVVEHDGEARSLAIALLEEIDLKVQEAESAEEALSYLRDHGDDVALLFSDVRLPCLMNGVDLARPLRLRWPWIRTIQIRARRWTIMRRYPGTWCSCRNPGARWKC